MTNDPPENDPIHHAKRSVAVYTSIAPTRENVGAPGFLISFCIDVLRRVYDVQVVLIDADSRLAKLGLSRRRIPEACADIYFVYPFHLYFSFSWGDRNVIVLGPDSPSLLFSRFAANATPRRRPKYFLLASYFLRLERVIVRRARLIVVGKEDAAQIRSAAAVGGADTRLRVGYLPHPFNPVYLKTRQRVRQPVRRLIFAGDLSRKYVGDCRACASVISTFERLGLLEEALFVGRQNRYLFEELCGVHGSAHKLRHVDWVDDYSELATPGRDIHVAPLTAGAGTKNRVLGSISLGVPVIGTEIAFENIELTGYSRRDLGLVGLGEVAESMESLLTFESKPQLQSDLAAFNALSSRKLLRLFEE